MQQVLTACITFLTAVREPAQGRRGEPLTAPLAGGDGGGCVGSVGGSIGSVGTPYNGG